MTAPRHRATLGALVLLLVAAGSPIHAVDDPASSAGGRISVAIAGAVTWVDAPRHFGIEGGWTVELADDALWLDDAALLVASGDAPFLKVVGTRNVRDADRLIRAGGVVQLSKHRLDVATPEDGSSGSLGGVPAVRRQSRRAGGVGSQNTQFKDDPSVRGLIVEFTADGFRLDSDGSQFDVVVTEETDFDGFDELAELAVGDDVEVEGELQGSTIIASRIRLRTGDDEVTLVGLILLLHSDGFDLDVDGSTIEVLVTPDTEFDGIDDLSDLSEGQWVEAKGTLVGAVLTATKVKLLDEDDGEDGVDFEYKGLLTTVLPPDQFAMDDGRVYTVTANTLYDALLGGYAGLLPGQYLEVKARRGPSAANLVVEIELEGDEQGGQGYRELEGVVLSVTSSEIVLEGGALVAVTPTTVFTGDADSAQDVLPGWWAEISALLDLTGDFTALSVRTDDREAATTGGQDFQPQQALVVPRPGASAADIAVRFGGQIVGTVGGLGALLWFQEPLTDDLLAALAADPDVAAVEPNYLFEDPESVRRRYPTIDRHPTTTKLVEQPAGTRIRMLQAQALADGEGVVVAVIDTGVDPLHPVLRRKLLPGGLDLVDGDLTPWEDRDGVDGDDDGVVDDAAGHGTFVASIVAITAPACSILPYRVLDDEGRGTAYHLAVAIADAIERRVDVINLSLVYRERSSAVDLLLERAAALGIVVVAAAGNDGSTAVPFPASDSHTVAVAALGESGLGLADFSNRSHLVGLAAPGEAIFGALDEQTFGTWSGTSMAAPFVTGTAALLLSADPGLDPVLLRNAIEQAGVVVEDAGWTGVALDALAAVGLVQRP